MSDARGRILVQHPSGADTYVSAIADVARGGGSTQYVRIGDAFAWLAGAVGIVLLLSVLRMTAPGALRLPSDRTVSLTRSSDKSEVHYDYQSRLEEHRMKELTSRESIEVDASPGKIWQVLTTLSYMKQWSELDITFAGESELHAGSKVLWVDEDGVAYATGTITRFEPERVLRNSPVFADWKHPVDPDEFASEFSLDVRSNSVRLHFSYGDFAKVPSGEAFFQKYLESVRPRNKELDSIKRLAER